MTEKLSNNADDEKFGLIKSNLETVFENIDSVCSRNKIDRNSITLLAATKTVDAKYINFAIQNGIEVIGENRVQELLSKYDEYDLQNADLQFIGHLQTNKVKYIIDKVSLIHSVDSFKLAKTVSDCAKSIYKRMPVLIEINIGNEESKGGIDKSEATELVHRISELDGVFVRGLMTIPPVCENKGEADKYFTNMYNLFVDIRSKNIDNISMDYLSMGMSADYCEAIACGANIVRVGSSIFGERKYR
ncbi:MAG: YggS family pyridoxal phosphate-dependent enzyme [Acutalibacteraceae bacterium]